MEWVTSLILQDADTFVATQEGDLSNVIAGSARAQVRGDAVTLAETSPFHAIVGAAEQDGRWWFVTRDGAYLRADDFLGPLTRVATTRGRGVQFSYRTWRGLLARVGEEGGAWLGHGDAFGPLAVDGTVLDAAFLDNGVGLVAVAPGALLRTADMGQTFTPVDVGPEGVRYVDVDPRDRARLLVFTTTGTLVSDGGALRPYGGDDPPAPAIPDSAERALRAALRLRAPIAHGTILTDDRVAWVTHDAFHVADRSASPPRDVHPPAGRCALHGWGPKVLASCGTEGGSELHVLGEGDRWSSLRVVRASERIVTSDDGRTLVVSGACESGRGLHERAPVCAYDGSGWATLHLSPNAHVLSVYGDRVLYETVSYEEDAASPLVSVRLSRMGDRDEGRPLTLEHGDAVARFAQFTSDGSVAAIAERGGRSFTALGPVDGPLALRPLPDGAEQVAFASSTRGVAVGRHLHECWATVDGARTWTPLRFPVDGDVSSVRVLRERTRYGEARGVPLWCGPQACWIGTRGIWADPSSAAARFSTAREALASTEPTPLDRPGERSGNQVLARDRWTCEPAAARPQDRARWARESTERRHAPGGYVDIAHAGADATSGRFTFTWSGVDDRGRFRARARPSELPPLAPPAPAATLAVVHVARGFVILRRCRESVYTDCELWAQRAGQGLTRLVALDAVAGTLQNAMAVQGTLGLADGGVAVHLGVGRAGRADVLLQLDARGQITRRRGTAWSEPAPHRFLAVAPEGPGLAVLSGASPRTVHFIGMDATRPQRLLGRVASDHAPLCQGASATRIVSLDYEVQQSVTLRADAATSLYRAGSQMAVLFGLDPSGSLCIQGFQGPQEPSFDAAGHRGEIAQLGGHPELRATPRGMELVVHGPSADQTSLCERTHE